MTDVLHTELGAGRARRRLLLGGSLAAMVTGTELLTGGPVQAAEKKKKPKPWSTKGNKGKTSSFLGTTNAAPLVIKTSGAERLRVAPGGQVGIGTTTPSARLDVAATTGPAIVARSSGQVGVLGAETSSATEGVGLWGSSSNGSGVFGEAPSGIGVRGAGGLRAGVLGTTSDVNGSGVEGNASASNAAGVFGLNTTGPGVWGRGTAGGTGVFGQSSGYAVYGSSMGGFGVYGTSTNGGVVGVAYVGVQGAANGTTDSQGVRGEDGTGGSSSTTYAGVFVGRVLVAGNLSKAGGSFLIDHPQDPANKYLSHSFVESPDMKNIYDGVVTCDGDGRAVVELPAYFEALNRDFRYQLTCLGGHAPVHVAEEIADNRFVVAGGTPGLRVSWQVTGTRQDAWAEQNRIVVEQDKPQDKRGTYLTPAAHGKSPGAADQALQPLTAEAREPSPR